MRWAALMATMTPGRWINLAAAVLGAIGAIVLFNGSFAYESFQPYHDRASIQAQTARDLSRQLKQRVGLGLSSRALSCKASLSFSIERGQGGCFEICCCHPFGAGG